MLDQVEANCHPAASALTGAVHGVCNGAEVDYSLARIKSLLGYSFHFCMLPDGAVTEHHSMIEWDLFFAALDRLGFKTQHFEAYLNGDWKNSDGSGVTSPSPAEEKKLKEDTWEAVCASIDRGVPAIAWSPMTVEQKTEGIGAFEWGLLAGYDQEQRTYTVHRWRTNKAFAVPYDGFGHVDGAHWYYVIVFGDHAPPDEAAVAKTTLEEAVAYANGTRYDKDVCCYPVAGIGFAAYEVWRDALAKGLPDTRSIRNNANELKLNRQSAAKFLRETTDVFDAPIAQTLSDAAACYDMEVAALNEVRNAARDAYEDGEYTSTHQRQVLSGVSAALAADKWAIGHIESALATML